MRRGSSFPAKVGRAGGRSAPFLNGWEGFFFFFEFFLFFLFEGFFYC